MNIDNRMVTQLFFAGKHETSTYIYWLTFEIITHYQIRLFTFRMVCCYVLLLLCFTVTVNSKGKKGNYLMKLQNYAVQKQVSLPLNTQT